MRGLDRARRFVGRPGAALLATVLLNLAAVVLVTWPLARQTATATLDTGEVLLTAWQLNWFHQALLTDPRAWADANIFFPYGNAAALNDLLLTHAAVTLPAAWAESPVLALNIALLGGIVLCGVFAHLLIVELTDTPWAATVGATLFALSPFRFLHLGHLSIAAAWAIPLFFWALLRHLRQPSGARAALVAVSGVAVGASSLYHAAFVAPIVPLVLLLGFRRGPGGRDVWVPLLAAGLPGVALLAWLFAPYAMALDTFGVASAPSDLGRYGADLSSLAHKPHFLSGEPAGAGLNPEARLYPGRALGLLALAGTVFAGVSLRRRGGWAWRAAVALLVLATVSGLGVLLPPTAALRGAWTAAVLTMIWIGPLLAIAWAFREMDRAHATGPAVAIGVGVAGAWISFVLALGPQARSLDEVVGPAPYRLLMEASSAFAGTRAPARFGGLVILFLALVAAGALATLLGARLRGTRRVGLVAVGLALVVCLTELPVPNWLRGRPLVPLPDLQDAAYAWIAEQPGRFGLLELPDWPRGRPVHWEHRAWRSLRYMLASKQHGQDLVNGTGRTRPFLWRRLRRLELWSDEFFEYVAAYLPVRYVLVHEGGLPVEARPEVWARLERGGHGWHEVFRSARVRVFTVDRSSGRGTFVDRLFLRQEITPRAKVVFSARALGGEPPGGDAGPGGVNLEMALDGDAVGGWTLDPTWRRLEMSLPVEATPRIDSPFPRRTAHLHWRSDEAGPGFEIRGLKVHREEGLSE